MGKIYVDQTALKIDLDTGIDLTAGVDSVYIRYQKPNTTETLEWTASIENESHVVKILNGGEIDAPGEWTFWAYVIFTDTTEAPGEPAVVVVHVEGE